MIGILSSSARDTALQYATTEELRRIFTEDADGLYQLSFLLTRDHEKAEQCFVAGLEDCVRANRVFRDWARAWAKRAIIQNAIRILQPRPGRASACLPETASARDQRLQKAGDECFEIDRVLDLDDFDRFVLILTVVEGYSDRNCSLLLGSSVEAIQASRQNLPLSSPVAQSSAWRCFLSRLCSRVDRRAAYDLSEPQAAAVPR